jgi:aspartyl-tRNA(Asn)/glutamyl-tRNA(Gln) amidotransferase subunit A
VGRFAQHPVDPRIDAQVQGAAQQLAALGCAVHESPPVEWAEEVNALWPAYSARGLARWFDAAGCDESLCGDAARATLQLGREAEDVDERASHAISTLDSTLAQVFDRFDAILTPATACLPWPAGQSHCALIDRQPVGPRGHAVFTAFANAAGLPAIALPTGFVGGLPTGVQLVAARGADAALLSLAAALESAHPRLHTWPLIS